METDDRDLLIALNEKVSSLCRSVDEVRNQMQTTYATKDWVNAQIETKVNGLDMTKSNNIIAFLNSKGGIILLVVLGLLIMLGMNSAMEAGGLTQQDIIDIVKQQMK